MAEVSGVTVWHVDLGQAAAALLTLEAELPRLSASEHARAVTISEPAAARMWLVAHVALRLALERALGADVRCEPFVPSPQGKPGLPRRSEGEAASVVFSLSHSKGQALVGLAPADPLGVDLETRRSVRIAPSRRRDIEVAAAGLCGAPLPDDETGRFLQAWVRLEAAAKADGSGMARVLTRAGAFGSRRGQGASVDLLPAGTRVTDLALGPDLYGAIAAGGDMTGVHVGRMPTDVDGLRAFAFG
jgi:4'-phosphopantetheinyl transferase